MAINIKSLNYIWIFIFWFNLVSGQVLESYPVFPEVTKLREKLVALEQSQVGVKELTGKNDGKEVNMYQKYVGLKTGDAYCAAGQSWAHGTLNIPNPMSGYSPDWFKTNLVYKKDEPRLIPWEPRIGQTPGFYIPSKKRIGHIGMIEQPLKNSCVTIEFNTNGMGSDEGQGVHRLIRKYSSFEAVSDFVGGKEYLAGMKNLKKK